MIVLDISDGSDNLTAQLRSKMEASPRSSTVWLFEDVPASLDFLSETVVPFNSKVYLGQLESNETLMAKEIYQVSTTYMYSRYWIICTILR